MRASSLLRPLGEDRRILPAPKRTREEDSDTVIIKSWEARGHKEQLVEFWRKGKFCDIVIEVDGEALPAHRCVLAGGSDFFAHAFESGCSESATGGTLRLEQLSAPAYKAAAEFFYTAEVAVDIHSLLPLLEAANFLQAAALQAGLVRAIFDRVTPDWFMDAWALAGKLSLASLEKALVNAVGRDLERLRSFARFDGFASLPEVVREQARPQPKSLTVVMERDGSSGVSKIERVKHVFKRIGAQDDDLAVTIDKQARVTVKWWVDAIHCHGGNGGRDYAALTSFLEPGLPFDLPRLERVGYGSARVAWQEKSPSRLIGQPVTSVYVADGYPKTLRYTAERDVKHYALTVDVGLSFDAALAKIPTRPLRPDEGWFRSDECEQKTQLHHYMLILFKMEDGQRVRHRYTPESTTSRSLGAVAARSDHSYAIAAPDIPSASPPDNATTETASSSRSPTSLAYPISFDDMSGDEEYVMLGGNPPPPRRDPHPPVVHFSKTSESEARDGWTAQHVQAMDQRLHTVHLITGVNADDNLLEFWYDLPAKRVLQVCTSDNPSTVLTGLWVEADHVPPSA